MIINLFESKNGNSESIQSGIKIYSGSDMLVIAAIWGWSNAEGFLKFILAIGIPVLMAALWGIFGVKYDPSRSGKTIVQTPGIVRLFVELSFFGFTCWLLFDLGYRKLSLIIIILIIVHYIFSLDRIIWFLKQK